MSWKTELHRADATERWTAKKAARQAAGWVDETARWLHSEQAAMMRYLPEQDAALRWWESGHDTLAPIDEVMPKWLAHFHGIDGAVRGDDTSETTGLSATAHMMHLLCSTRGRQIDHGAIVGCSPTVMAVLATISQSGAYLVDPAIDVAALGSDTGTIVLPQSLHRPGPSDGAGQLPGASATQTLRAISWIRETVDGVECLRVLDWTDISGSNGDTGDARLDQHVRDHMQRQNIQMPPMLFNGEWRRPCTPAATTEQARRRIAEAAADNDSGPWTPGKTLLDDPYPLAVRLLAALGDAAVAGLVTGQSIAVTRTGDGPGSATVFTEPGA